MGKDFYGGSFPPIQNFRYGETLSDKCTFGVGGRTDYYFEPKTISELCAAIASADEYGIEVFLLGGGSNVLISDKGFRGLTVSVRALNGINVDGSNLTAQCGVKLSKTVDVAESFALGGAEFLSGIPGSVGGALIMNAGCYGKSVCDIVKSVTVFCRFDGKIKVYDEESCGELFFYRDSVFQKRNEVVLECVFKLSPSSPEQITQMRKEAAEKRRAVQPKGKSAGSVFKNIPSAAGKIIDECGLKGERIGGAFVSEKHANFIINDGEGSAEDIFRLIARIKDEVKKRKNIILSEEIKYIGDFQ